MKTNDICENDICEKCAESGEEVPATETIDYGSLFHGAGKVRVCDYHADKESLTLNAYAD